MIASRAMQRANTIPEMALVLSLVMLMLFGIVQYALVGFNQIGVDGAAFVGDHAAVAYYSSPTTSNVAYAQQVGLANFPQTGKSTYTASIPASGDYEMNLSSSTTVIGGMTNLFPSTVSARSRIIEPSQSQASTNTPPGQCANAAENITYNGTSILNSSAVDLLGNIPTDQLYNVVTVNGVSKLQVNQSVLSNAPTALGTFSTNLNNTVSQLTTISNTLAAINAIVPGLGTSLGTTISTSISPLLASATGGTYTSGGITLQTPLTAAQFATQQAAASKTIAAAEAANTNPLLATLFSTLNAALNGSTLTGGIGVNGLLGGPSGGILAALNNAQNAIYALNSAVKPCTTY
jgi:hypothetical protein